MEVNMRMLFMILFCLSIVCLANVDMIMGDETQNELIIGWGYSGSVFLGKYSGGTYTDVVEHSGMNAAAVARATDSSAGEHILLLPYVDEEFGVPVQIFTYSYGNLTPENYCPVPSFQMHDRFGFLKTEDPRWDALLAYSNVAFCSSVTELRAYQVYFDIDSSGLLTGISSAYWEKNYYWKGYGRQKDVRAVMVGPVICPGGYPLIATSFGHDGGSGGWLMNHSLIFNPDSSELLCYTIGEFWDPVESGVMGLGSSSDTGAILLFADSLGEESWSYYTTFQPDPLNTSLLPWSFPDHDDPVALSPAAGLPGTLMVWYREGQIRCRYWNGQWNNYDYFVASSMFPPMIGDISVCADTDGYWVAWLPVTASEPLVAFIDFGSVTGLPGQTEGTLDPAVILRPVGNPVSGPLSVEVQGTESGQISVLDLSGRIVHQIEASGEGVYQLGELPVPGVYLIRLIHPGGVVSARVVSIR
jgi:hypothetical protein